MQDEIPNNKGFVQLPREFFFGPLWTQKREYSKAEAWIDISQKVRYGEAPVSEIINEKLITYGKNQWPASIRYLAKRWRWGNDKVMTFLKMLKDHGMIDVLQKGGQNIIEIRSFSTASNPLQSSEHRSLQPSRYKPLQPIDLKSVQPNTDGMKVSSFDPYSLPDPNQNTDPYSLPDPNPYSLQNAEPYKEEESKESKKKVISEPQPVTYWEREQKAFLTNLVFQEQFCVARRLALPALIGLQEHFIQELVLKDDIKDRKGIQSHFVNWFTLCQQKGIIDQAGLLKTAAPKEKEYDHFDRITAQTNAFLDQFDKPMNKNFREEQTERILNETARPKT